MLPVHLCVRKVFFADLFWPPDASARKPEKRLVSLIKTDTMREEFKI